MNTQDHTETERVHIEIDEVTVVRRRDYLLRDCAKCEDGFYADECDGTLKCWQCDDVTPRWMTKREFLEHMQSVQKEEELISGNDH
jgi:hypothetical protein